MPSATFIKAMQALTTDEEFLTLIRIEHEDIDPAEFPNGVCVVASNQNVTSNGIEYVAYPVKVKMPEKNPQVLPRAQIQIDNIDRSILKAIRLLQGRKPILTVSTVLRSSPDMIEEGPLFFELNRTPWDRYTITADLGTEPILNETWPKHAFTPATHPGVF